MKQLRSCLIVTLITLLGAASAGASVSGYGNYSSSAQAAQVLSSNAPFSPACLDQAKMLISARMEQDGYQVEDLDFRANSQGLGLQGFTKSENGDLARFSGVLHWNGSISFQANGNQRTKIEWGWCH